MEADEIGAPVRASDTETECTGAGKDSIVGITTNPHPEQHARGNEMHRSLSKASAQRPLSDRGKRAAPAHEMKRQMISRRRRTIPLSNAASGRAKRSRIGRCGLFGGSVSGCDMCYETVDAREHITGEPPVPRSGHSVGSVLCARGIKSRLIAPGFAPVAARSLPFQMPGRFSALSLRCRGSETGNCCRRCPRAPGFYASLS